jgi:trans-aconitate methyltransferase
MDFGCGTGSTIPLFFDVLGAERVIALEDSVELLSVASRQYAGSRVTLARPSSFHEVGSCDLVFCSAVFHHVPPAARSAVARQIHTYLRPDGLLALWEHNSWSPAARYMMSRCEFDRGARPIAAPSARKMLAEAGFEILATDFLFIFPRFLRTLRWSERPLASFPLGAQFQVLAQKAG